MEKPDNPEFSSVVQLVPSVCEAIDSNPSTKKERTENSEAKMFENLETWVVYPRLSEQQTRKLTYKDPCVFPHVSLVLCPCKHQNN